MKLHLLFVAIIMLSVKPLVANEADSAWLFAYATGKNNDHNGLHYAWSTNGIDWHAIGPETRFLFCDFGSWGSEKRMISPFLIKDNDGVFHCIWTLNEKVGQFAHTASNDLYTWKPQSYPEVMQHGNIKDPEVYFNAKNKEYVITWESVVNGKTGVYKTTTADFKKYSPTTKGNKNDRFTLRKEISIHGEIQKGTLHKLPWQIIDGLIKHQQWLTWHNEQRAEGMSDDAWRYKSLTAIDATIELNASKSKKISDMLMGVFFEDINYAADGGIYAELVQNRSFEYALGDKKFRDSTWNHLKAWEVKGDGLEFRIDTALSIHQNNRHYAVLHAKKQGGRIENEGFDGIVVKKNEKYIFSVFARMVSGERTNIIVSLLNHNGESIGEAVVEIQSSEWKKYEAILTGTENMDHAKLSIAPQKQSTVAVDMVSLFPENTFKKHRNGLRADLAQTIADLHPRFIRFPGGCVAHGDGLNNMYRWKNTVGPPENRKTQRNIWNYHQSAGLGYFEYFQFCEDIGAEPLPVLPAAVPCQNSSVGGHGQQGGVPMEDMDDYVQEVLDLIEWANGDASTNWGKVRAEAGHPEPFNLKYIGIGNEDLITDIFAERFTLIFKALKEKHPEITVIGTVGPFYMGSDYDAGWELATKLNVPIVDEHYYQPPGWFINNQDFYDRYDRNKSKVYLGEYAAHVRGRKMNMETALSEALYLACVERNADVVHMTSFAPLLAKEGHTQWNPDLIYFNNTEVKPTVDYYVQQMYGKHAGDLYIPGFITFSNTNNDVTKRVVYSVVKNSEKNELIIKFVNLLPVEVNTSIELDSFFNSEKSGTVSVLKGKPDDQHVKPQTVQLKVYPDFKYVMPAYSFSVINIPLN